LKRLCCVKSSTEFQSAIQEDGTVDLSWRNRICDGDYCDTNV
jgi:hypothetical protein